MIAGAPLSECTPHILNSKVAITSSLHIVTNLQETSLHKSNHYGKCGLKARVKPYLVPQSIMLWKWGDHCVSFGTMLCLLHIWDYAPLVTHLGLCSACYTFGTMLHLLHIWDYAPLVTHLGLCSACYTAIQMNNTSCNESRLLLNM